MTEGRKTMKDSTGAAAVKVGGVILGVIVIASALGGQTKEAVNDTGNDLMKKGAVIYGGKKAIDEAARRLGGGGLPGPGGGGGSSSKKDEPQPAVAPPVAAPIPDEGDDDEPALPDAAAFKPGAPILSNPGSRDFMGEPVTGVDGKPCTPVPIIGADGVQVGAFC